MRISVIYRLYKLFLILGIFFVYCSTNSRAQDTRIISFPDDLEGRPGEEIEVPVTINNANDVTGFLVGVYIENTSEEHPVEFLGFETEGTLLEGRESTWTTVTNNQSRAEDLGYVVFVGSTATDLLSGSGALIKLVLRIKDNASVQDYPLEFWDEVTSLNDGNIPSNKIDGELSIGEAIPTTPTPEITASPTIDQSTNVTPTPSITSKPTLTPTPTLGEPTNTPRPGNVVPRISVSPGDHLVLLQGEQRELLVVAYDPDRGDMIEVSLSNGAPASFTSVEQFPNYTLAEYELDTSELGHFYFTVFAYDGSDTGTREILLSVVDDLNAPTITPRPKSPTPTVTPTYTSTFTPTNTPLPTLTFTPTGSPSVTPTATNTFTPRPTRPKPVYVTDSAETFEDLTGETDFDFADLRQLTIRWDVPKGNATDWHVFVRKGLSGQKFLGHTGNGEDKRLDWYPGNTLISDEFQKGPDFNALYIFRVIRVDDHLTKDDVYDQALPIGFNLQGSKPVMLSDPEMPHLKSKKVAIYDDILGGDNIAPQGSEGFDVDIPSRRGIHIAWNFQANLEDVLEYHVDVKIDDGDYEFMGQTNDHRINYFWWTPNQEFSTQPPYQDGPQHEKTYQFRITLVPLSGEPETMESGVLHYYVSEDNTDIPFPTFTSTPTQPPTPTPMGSPTPTHTITPTFTPTAVIRVTPAPYSIYPHDEEGNTVTVVLLGLPSGAKTLDMNLIPAGKFTMGSPQIERGCEVDEGPRHEVTISKNLYVGIYEITQAQWRVVMGRNPAWFDDDFNKPVESVNWFDCQDFVSKLNDEIGDGTFRLPTEAEWEYACRAETTTRFSFGDALECADEGSNFCELMDKYMWWWGNVDWGSKPVGEKKPNPWGLHDMHGNVLEWCQDWYGNYPSFAVTDPAGTSNGNLRVMRGGKWGGHARNARSARRFAQDPEDRFINGGLRIVWQVEK